jgi:hypothetical protein
LRFIDPASKPRQLCPLMTAFLEAAASSPTSREPANQETPGFTLGAFPTISPHFTAGTRLIVAHFLSVGLLR